MPVIDIEIVCDTFKRCNADFDKKRCKETLKNDPILDAYVMDCALLPEPCQFMTCMLGHNMVRETTGKMKGPASLPDHP